jgi:hypothetical protein
MVELSAVLVMSSEVETSLTVGPSDATAVSDKRFLDCARNDRMARARDEFAATEVNRACLQTKMEAWERRTARD